MPYMPLGPNLSAAVQGGRRESLDSAFANHLSQLGFDPNTPQSLMLQEQMRQEMLKRKQDELFRARMQQAAQRQPGGAFVPLGNMLSSPWRE